MTVQPPGNVKKSASRVVMLLNFGGPRNLEEVESFLYEILKDPNTIQLPLPQWIQNRLARFIAGRRSPEVSRQYGEIGGRSPLVEATERISEALHAVLITKASQGFTPPVLIAHRYLEHHTRDTVAHFMGIHRAEPVPEILAVPLYPHFSYATSGSSFQQLQMQLSAAGWKGHLSIQPSYPDAPGYLQALSDRLEAVLQAEAPPPETTVILCSAHGLPKVYLERGDPYRDELYRTLEPLRQRFSGWRFELSFQSRVGPQEWLKPYTDQIIPELAREGVRQLVFLPVAFVNDHIETLYEIGVTYFNLARLHGITPYLVPAVEDHPGHIQVLAEAVEAWVDGKSSIPVEAGLPPSQFWRRQGPWMALAIALGLAGATAILLGWL